MQYSRREPVGPARRHQTIEVHRAYLPRKHDEILICELARETLTLSVQDVDLQIATMLRAGELAPILYLHGFGSTKEDFADIVCHPAFAGRAVVA
jgi:hypothetical protein